MQRVRIGLTGLGFVFIVVLLATALAGVPEADTAPANGMAATDLNKAAPQEPLAELGVTPGNPDQNGAHIAGNQAHPAYR